MMNHVVLQFTRLENLLAEAAGADAVRVHVMAQTETAASAVLTRKEIRIGLCVRAIVPGYKILSWYCPVDKFSFYLPERPANGSGRSPEQARYETAWQQATTMQDELVALLRRDEQSVYDLPDIDFRSLYDAGEMAQTAAEEALAAADFPFEEMGVLE